MTVEELYTLIEGDYESAKRTMMNDKIISRFITKLLNDKSFDQLMAAAETLDPTGLFESAHAMKGVYANLGLVKLSNMSDEITEQFRPGKERTLSDEEVRSKIAALKELYLKTVEGIQQFVQEQ